VLAQTSFDLSQKEMSNAWIDRWNDRYRSDEFAYGEQPNLYLKEQLEKLPAGSILFPAEGEGRNAVFAATLGWSVAAFDISAEGKNKALRLATANHVSVDYQLGDLSMLHYAEGQFDALALIYAHFPADLKSTYHRQLSKYLRNGGVVIFEAFSKNHLSYLARNEKVGGPKEIDMLFSTDELKADFEDYEILVLEEKEIELHEGEYNNGVGSVVRFVGRKK
jgi:2-polyprenyl-3-methyl-5-hydroxy-6-metoxy-1,4-benzoquinol methylase